MDRNIKDFNPQIMPKTPLKLMMQDSSGTSCRIFLNTWNWIKMDPISKMLLHDTPIPLGTKMKLGDFHEQYVLWCEFNGINKIESKISMGRDLAERFSEDGSKMKWITRLT